MPKRDDVPLSKEELEMAEKGEALIAKAVSGVEAPQSLREAIHRDRIRAQAPPRASIWRRRRRALTATIAVAAAAVLVAALALQGGSSDAGPSLAKIEATAQLSATKPAPAPNGGNPPTLAVRVGALSFPDWEQGFGWRAIGSRADTISGRNVITVSYRNRDGARLDYAVVAGTPIGEHPGGRKVIRAGKTYSVAGAGERTVITWTQQGHTCMIVAASAVPQAELVNLAASRNT